MQHDERASEVDRRLEDAERNERARRARIRRDAAKGPGQNLEQGVDFIRFTQEFAAAFEKARRAG